MIAMQRQPTMPDEAHAGWPCHTLPALTANAGVREASRTCPRGQSPVVGVAALCLHTAFDTTTLLPRPPANAGGRGGTSRRCHGWI